MASKDEIKRGVEILKRGLEKQAPFIAEILSSPLKHHDKDCQCNGCLVAARKREIRAEAIKRREANK